VALRILLADDSMTAQNMGKKILTDAGFDVVTVSNGAAAVKKLAESSPDIAILDVYMPGYTGLEVCERMKSTPATARVPVLLSVGKMEPFRPEDGMKVKADGVIIKPFEATDLVTVVDKLAERSYGPDAKTTGIVPAEVFEAIEEAPLDASFDILAEPAPAKDVPAEGLQTFTPVADGGKFVAQEPNIEFTSAPKTGAVQGDSLDDLMTTVLQPQPAEPATDENFVAPVEEADEQPGPVARAVAAGAEIADEMPSGEVFVAVAEPSAQVQAIESAPEVVQQTVAETIKPVISEPATVEAETATDVIWNSVEAEVSVQNVEPHLDLEKEMQAIAEEQTALGVPLPEPQQIATVEVAAPFLAPLGKTSFDEFDAVMEQVSAEPVMSASAEEVPLLVENDVTVEEASGQDSVLLDDEATANPTAAAPVMLDEVIVPLDSQTESTPITPALDVADAGLEEPAPSAENATEEIEAAPVQESTVDELEVLDIAPEEDSQSPLLADTSAEAKLSALSYYGLADDGHEETFRNPIEELDEPLFSLVDDDPQPVHVEPAEAVCAEAVVADPVDEPLLSEETLAGELQVASVPDVLEEPAADPVVDDVVAPVLEDVAAAPVMVEEIVAPVEIPAVAPMASEQVAQPTASAAVAPAFDDAMVNGIVGRVVDRVVDRLKPILVVMVEEILKELKSK
jgi:CheY-like chemotaxis protein